MPIEKKYVVDTLSLTGQRALAGRPASKTLSINLQPYTGEDQQPMAGMPLTLTIDNPSDSDVKLWVEGAVVTGTFSVDKA